MNNLDSSVKLLTRNVDFLVAVLIVVSLVFFVVPSWAAPIITDPIKTYRFKAADNYGSAPSISALLSSYNTVAMEHFNQCKQADTYTCWTDAPYTNTGQPFGTRKINGEPTDYVVHSPGSYIQKTSIETRDLSRPGDGVVQAIYSCPQPFSMSHSGPDDDTTLQCILPEKQSCAFDGNPINIGTGEKFEHEVDYSSADGSLRVDRYYVNQFAGWTFTTPQEVTLVPPNGRVEAREEYTYPVTYYRINSDPQTGARGLESYIGFHKLYYTNPLPQTAAYLTIGRQRYRFVETESGFVGDGPINERVSLSRISPATDGSTLKLVQNNGDAFYFLPSGLLRHIDFSDGKSVAYEYNGKRLLSSTDHLGRSLTYAYDEYDRVIAITTPDQQTISYQFGTDKNSADFNFLKKVTWSNGESVSYLYNEPANLAGASRLIQALTGKIDAQGNRIGTYKYYGSNAVSTQGALGTLMRNMSFEYLATTVTDGLNTSRKYSFKELGDGTRLVTGVSQPAGSGCAASTQNATYYPNTYLKNTETDFNGHKKQFAYDMTRKLETVRVEGVPKADATNYLPAAAVLAAGVRKISTQWHTQLTKPSVVAEPNLLTTYIYNGDMNPFNGNAIAQCAPISLPLLCHKVEQATTDANGAAGLSAVLNSDTSKREWLFTYNGRGQQLTRARAVGGLVEEAREYYEFSGANYTKGDLKKITNALGQNSVFNEYDANGRVLRMLDVNNVETQYTYDQRGRLTKQSIAGAASTTHSYDLNGNRITSVLPNGVILNYQYDLAKRLVSIENALGDKIHYEYDVESNLRFERITNISGAIGYIKEHVYDALSREQNTVNSFGQSRTSLYDANGNLTGEVDAKQQTSTKSFDSLNQIKGAVDALNGSTSYSYDNQGNITQVKDAKGNSTLYSYNAFGDLVTQTSPDTGITIFTYDALGNRISATDARGVQVQYSYDELNRLTSIKYPAAPIENVSYIYDEVSDENAGIGRLTSVTNNGAVLTYTYNTLGLIASKATTVNGVSFSTQYLYDAAGNLSQIFYPSGRVVSYARDLAGRVQSIKTQENILATQDTVVTGITYLPFGPASNYTFGNGLTHSTSYDNDYRLTGIQVGGIFDRAYTYDPVDNITDISNLVASSKSQSFTYDALNRLLTANGIYGALAYTYDTVGNRTSEKTDRGATHLNDTYSYSPTSNRLTSISKTSGGLPSGARSFSYDEAGNRIQGAAEDGKVQNYTYNKANRLETAKVTGILAGTYAYNALGQRVSKTLADGSKEIYHYDEAGQLIVVADSAGNTVREYIYNGTQLVGFINIE